MAFSDAIVDGSRQPCQGPCDNQAGEEAVKACEAQDDVALLGLDWYVEGVQGQLTDG